MPETDVTKMKVADLKRELKIRGLPTTGNKNELQDRLQTALLDGEISLEDTAISGEDLFDDSILTDEEEAKILAADERELLKSPTPTGISGEFSTSLKSNNDNILEASVLPKKIHLKRTTSISTIQTTTTTTTAAAAALLAKENTEPEAGSVAKKLKPSEKNPIVMNAANNANVTSATKSNDTGSKLKINQLSDQERLELRAKKFGLATTAAAANTTKPSNSTTGKGTISTSVNPSTPEEIEKLKKRAERFGCSVSSKMVKMDIEDKLLKRKQRFGGVGGAVETNVTTTNKATIETKGDASWAEKAQKRLERFKTTATT